MGGKLKSSSSHLNPLVLSVKVLMPSGVKSIRFTLGFTDYDGVSRFVGSEHAYVPSPWGSVHRAVALAELALDLWEDGQPKATQAKATWKPPPPPCCRGGLEDPRARHERIRGGCCPMCNPMYTSYEAKHLFIT
jgi:hypothetical protein